MKNSNYTPEKYFNQNPNWYKLRITARKPKEGEPEVEYAFTSGSTKEQVLADARKGLGLGYFVEIKNVSFETIIKELDNATCR